MATGFGDEPRPQTMSGPVAFDARKLRPPFDDARNMIGSQRGPTNSLVAVRLRKTGPRVSWAVLSQASKAATASLLRPKRIDRQRVLQ